MKKFLAFAFVLASAALVHAADPPKKPELTIEDVMMRLFEEPDAHFHKARERFFKREYKGAAAAIRTASAFVKLEGTYSTKDGEEMLRRSTAELERLADGIEDGTIRNAKVLDRVFARAHVAMGKGHNLKAVQLLGKGNVDAAGKQFQASFHHAIHAYQWGGVEEKEDAKKILEGAGKLAQRVAARAKGLQAEIKKDVAALGKVLEELSRELRVNEEMKEIWDPMH